MGVAQGIEQIRSALNRSARQFFPDLCSISSLVPSTDDSGGSGDTATPLASNVPCSYKSLSPSQLQVAGRVLVGLSHVIKLPSNAVTQGIKPTQQIVIAARGNTPALTFQNPVVLDNATAPFVSVAAMVSEQ